MTVEYMHIGILALSKREGMTCNEDMKFCVNNMDGYDFKVEYLKFEGGTPFPEIPSKQPHVVYGVDNLGCYTSQAQRIIFGPADCSPSVCLVFVIQNDAIVELYEEE